MTDPAFRCLMQIGREEDEGTNGLILRLRSHSEGRSEATTVARRLALASEWALDLDAQYRDLVRAGRSPQIRVPAMPHVGGGRVRTETLAEYRTLRLGTGELIRPLLLDPPELKELYPFQRQGVEWLRGRCGAILADDMGLGKTVQVISAMRLLFNRAAIRNVLVVCPKGLVATWERELGRWAPELGVAILTPPARIREDAWRTVAGRCHVLLTHYEQLRTPPHSPARESARPRGCGRGASSSQARC